MRRSREQQQAAEDYAHIDHNLQKCFQGAPHVREVPGTTYSLRDTSRDVTPIYCLTKTRTPFPEVSRGLQLMNDKQYLARTRNGDFGASR